MYDRNVREPNAVLYAFVEDPRVLPATAHGSNTWRHFKLDIGRHRSTNGMANIAKYAGQCARASALSRFARSDAEYGPDYLLAMRVEGTIRLQGVSESSETQQHTDSAAHVEGDAADRSRESHPEGVVDSAQLPSDHVDADRDVTNRLEQRLREIEALRGEMPAPTTTGQSIARERWAISSKSPRASTARTSAVLVSDALPLVVAPPSAQWRRSSSAPSSSQPITVVDVPVPVNHDDAEDAQISAILDQLKNSHSASLSLSQQRRRDALKTCADELSRRTSESRLSIAAVLLEAVSLKRSHTRIAEVCAASVASSDFASEVRDLLRAQHAADQGHTS